MMLANNLQTHQVGRRVSNQSLAQDGDQTTVPQTMGVNVYESSPFNRYEVTTKSRPFQAEPDRLAVPARRPVPPSKSSTVVNTVTRSGQTSPYQESKQLHTQDDKAESDYGDYNIENEIAQNALDMMMADVLLAKQETMEKQEALDHAEAERSSLQQTVNRLTARLIEDGDFRRKKEREYLERIASADAEMRAMQETNSQLNTETEKWKLAATSKQQESETATSSSQALLQQHEALKSKIQEVEGSVASKDAALSRSEADRQKFETRVHQLQNALATMQQETQQRTVLQNEHAALLDSHAAEVAEMRRMLDYFKTTSQKLSVANKNLTAANTSLQEAMHNATLELNQKNDQIRSLHNDNAELQGLIGPALPV